MVYASGLATENLALESGVVEPLVEGGAGHAEEARGQGLIVFGPFHGLVDQHGGGFAQSGQALEVYERASSVGGRQLSWRCEGGFDLHSRFEDVGGQAVGPVLAQGLENHGFEFANVPRKGVVGQECKEFFGRFRSTLAKGARRLVEEVFDEQGNVVFAFAQGRHVNPVNLQAIVEVVTETSFSLEHIEVLICGDQKPGGTSLGNVGAEGKVLVFLDEPEQFDLGCRAEVADFVEEERAVGGVFDKTSADVVGAGKRAADVAEEGVAEYGVVESSGVNGGELARAATEPVDCPGNPLFSGAGFAGYEHGAERSGDGLAVAEDGVHGGVVRNDAVEGFGVFEAVGAEALGQQGVLSAEFVNFNGALDAGNEAALLDGLEHVVEGAGFHACDGGLDFIGHREDGDGQIGILIDDLGKKLESGQAGHGEVQKNGAEK